MRKAGAFLLPLNLCLFPARPGAFYGSLAWGGVSYTPAVLGALLRLRGQG